MLPPRHRRRGSLPRRAPALVLFAAVGCSAQCNVATFTSARTTVNACRTSATGDTMATNRCSCTHVSLYDKECTTNQCINNAQVGSECQKFMNDRVVLQQQCAAAGGSSGTTGGAMPCLSDKAACRDSMLVVGPQGALVESLEWQQGVQQEQWETSRCNNAQANCWGGKPMDCTRYEQCTPQAAQCLTGAAVAAYGSFRTAECQAFVTCKKSNAFQTCTAAYAPTMVSVVQGQGQPCDAAVICQAAQDLGTSGLGCSARGALDCEQDTDCTWHQDSGRCWDKPSDRETIELVLISLAAAIIGCIVIICIAYVLFAHQNNKTAGFGNQPRTDDREMLAMDPNSQMY